MLILLVACNLVITTLFKQEAKGVNIKLFLKDCFVRIRQAKILGILYTTSIWVPIPCPQPSRLLTYTK